MKKYVIRRLFSVIPVLWLVSVLVFSLIHLVPGDPVLVILGTTAEKAQVETSPFWFSTGAGSRLFCGETSGIRSSPTNRLWK